MRLVRALAAVAGGPPAGKVGPVDDELADVLIGARLAVDVTRLEDRLDDLDFRSDR